MTTRLHLLSAGAAMGLVRAVEMQFTRSTGATLGARFGAVGAMKEALLAGDPCDAFITTAKMLQELAAAGAVHALPCRPLGSVAAGIAVRAGDSKPRVDSPAALSSALLAAPAIYFPDPERATAGIHFLRVLGELSLAQTLRPRLRTFPNGAAAMREMATAGPAGSIGCTQVSEILFAAGLHLAGPLPAPHGLLTLYSAGVAATAPARVLAEQFVELLSASTTRPLRLAAGFEDPT
jgi:molybdate transport system substrate-binding protein